MTEEREQSVLRRKAEAGRPKPDGAPMTVERALSLALTRAADEGMGLPLRVTALAPARRSLADLPESLETMSLLGVLEGPAEGLGLCAIPPATLSAMIEMQTMGRLAAKPPAPRKPTRTDAAMVAEFIDKALIQFEEALAPMAEIVWAGGFRYASFLDDPRPLGLLLEDIGYRSFAVSLSLGPAGEREGTLLLVLPAQGRGPGPRTRAAAAPETGDGAAAGGAGAGAGAAPDPQAAAQEWSGRMERTVLGTRVELEGVLHRVTLPLSAVMALVPGQVLALPDTALETLRLEGAGRQTVSFARLGQAQGMRALRLILAPQEITDGTGEPEGAAVLHHAPPASYAAPRTTPPATIDTHGGGGADGTEGFGRVPPMEDLPALGGFPAMGDLPPLGDLPALGDLPPLDDLPPLRIGTG